MKKACRNRITTWGMMGLLVVGLNVWFALPARATPIDYVLINQQPEGGFPGGPAVGGFTLDDTLATPYITWNITVNGLNFNNLTDDTVQINGLNPAGFGLETVANGIQFRITSVPPPNTFPDHHSQYELALFHFPSGGELYQERGGLGTTVPEPSPGVLLLIGLLVLAGARWWTHRQERLQLG